MADTVPTCIGIIMDGNRRYAKARGMKPWEGHAEGNKKFKEVLGWAHARGIRNVIVYAFSTENWKRSEEEVGQILMLARSFFQSQVKELVEARIRVRFAGDVARFPEDIQQMIAKAEAETRDFTEQTVMIAASYGGRAEILAATRTLLAQGIAQPSEQDFADALWTNGFPDPDMLIRTGGEQRLSNFLPWQATYSELFFSSTLWPDLTEHELDAMLAEYGARKRNFGV